MQVSMLWTTEAHQSANLGHVRLGLNIILLQCKKRDTVEEYLTDGGGRLGTKEADIKVGVSVDGTFQGLLSLTSLL